MNGLYPLNLVFHHLVKFAAMDADWCSVRWYSTTLSNNPGDNGGSSLSCVIHKTLYTQYHKTSNSSTKYTNTSTWKTLVQTHNCQRMYVPAHFDGQLSKRECNSTLPKFDRSPSSRMFKQQVELTPCVKNASRNVYDVLRNGARWFLGNLQLPRRGIWKLEGLLYF